MEERPFTAASYEQFLKEERLMGSRCKRCGALFLPPRALCAECHNGELEWVEMRGKGKLAAFTCITVGPPFMLEEGYDREHPYCVGVVELEEGVKIDARLEGIDATKPEAIQIGMPLAVKFLHRGQGEEGRTFLAFKPL